MLMIRLRRMGARNAPFYRVVVSDSRKVPGSSALEEVGYYDPTKTPSVLSLDQTRIDHWVGQGARLSSTVRNLIRNPPSQEAPPAKPKKAAPSEPEKPPEAEEPAAASAEAAEPAAEAAEAEQAAGEASDEAETEEAQPEAESGSADSESETESEAESSGDDKASG